MMTVGQLAQHLLSIDPQKNQARLAFYHFLKNFLPLDTILTSETIDMFYDRALLQHHWQQNKAQLGEIIKDDLKAIAMRRPLGLDLSELTHAHELQVITIEQPRDFAALLAREVKRLSHLGEKVRNFRIELDKSRGSEEVLFVRLAKDGSIIAEIWQNTAVIVGGQIQLLRPHTRLEYSNLLELRPRVAQIINLTMLRTGIFTVNDQNITQITGRIVQGTTFHTIEQFDKNIKEIPEIYRVLQKIEGNFLQPSLSFKSECYDLETHATK